MSGFVKLGDLTHIRTGKLDANASSENGQYPFFTCSKEPLRIASYSYDCECVLVAGNGDLNVKYYDGKFDAYQRTYIIESADKRKLLVKYLYFFLDIYVEVLRTQSIGGVIKYIKLSNLTDALIPLPSIKRQAEIIECLEKCNTLIDKRQREIALIEQTVKSRFIELFGDPIKNTQHRPTTAFVNVVTMQRGFDLPVQDRKQSGNIPVYGSNGVLDHHNQAKVCNGGVITGRSGTIGKVFYTTGAYWPLNTTLFSVDTHENNIIYLAHLVRMFNLDRFTEGTGVPTLNRNKFHSAPIIDVPIDEQNQFAAFVEQTDKSKYYSSLSFRYCQAAANTYRQEWMTCRTSDF